MGGDLAEEAADAALQFARRERDEFVRAASERLHNLAARAEALGRRAERRTDEAAYRIRAEIKRLEAEQRQIREELEALQASSESAWERIKKGVDRALDDLVVAYDEAAAEFDDTDESRRTAVDPPECVGLACRRAATVLPLSSRPRLQRRNDTMNSLSRDTLWPLVESSDDPCVSVVCPIESGESQKNQLLIKNLIQSADTQATQRGIDPATRQALLAPMNHVLHHRRLLQSAGCGIGLFSSAQVSMTVDLPDRCMPCALVGSRFYVLPLAPFLSEQQSFLVLAISLNNVQLYSGDRISLQALSVPNMPVNIDEALGYDDNQNQPPLQYHTGAQAGRHGRRHAVFHGQGVNEDERRKKDVRRFCRRVSQAIAASGIDFRLPIIIAGVESLWSQMRDAINRHRVLEEFIPGNPEHRSIQELHTGGCAALKRRLRAQSQNELSHLGEALANGSGADELQVVLPAAWQGRVSALFAAADRPIWGRLDEHGNMHVDDGPTGRNDELVNHAVIATCQKGGRTHLVDGADLPNGAAVAAIMRY